MTPMKRLCELGLNSRTLSDWQARELLSEDLARIERHIPTCAVCQQTLRAYDQIRQAVRTQALPMTAPRLWRDTQQKIYHLRGTMNIQRKSLILGSLGVLAVLVISFALVFASATINHGTSTQPTATHLPTSTTTAIPTQTPLATVDSTTTAEDCGQYFAPAIGTIAQTFTYYRVGDFIITDVLPGHLSYPLWSVPDKFPINPRMGHGGGLAFGICNVSSSQSHTLLPLDITVKSLTPITPPIDFTNPCQFGCGGDQGPTDTFQAQWPTNIQINTTASLIATTNDGTSNYPLKLLPHQVDRVWLRMNYPSIDGAYTFAVGIQIDGVRFAFEPTTGKIIFINDLSKLGVATVTPTT